MVRYFGAADVVDLQHGFSEGRITPDPAAAWLVFEIAAAGDPVARQVINSTDQACPYIPLNLNVLPIILCLNPLT